MTHTPHMVTSGSGRHRRDPYPVGRIRSLGSCDVVLTFGARVEKSTR
jgi:hypothetical protein